MSAARRKIAMAIPPRAICVKPRAPCGASGSPVFSSRWVTFTSPVSVNQWDFFLQSGLGFNGLQQGNAVIGT